MDSNEQCSLTSMAMIQFGSGQNENKTDANISINQSNIDKVANEMKGVQRVLAFQHEKLPPIETIL